MSSPPWVSASGVPARPGRGFGWYVGGSALSRGSRFAPARAPSGAIGRGWGQGGQAARWTSPFKCEFTPLDSFPRLMTSSHAPPVALVRRDRHRPWHRSASARRRPPRGGPHPSRRRQRLYVRRHAVPRAQTPPSPYYAHRLPRSEHERCSDIPSAHTLTFTRRS